MANHWCKQRQQQKQNVIYCKEESKEIIEEAVLSLKEKYPEHKVYSDVCTNDCVTRKSFRKLIKSINAGNIGQLVVLRKSSLSISQIGLLECILDDHGVCLIEVEKEMEDIEIHAKEVLSSVYETLKLTFKGIENTKSKKQKIEHCTDDNVVIDKCFSIH